MNDVKLQEGHPLDENLRPVKIGGKNSSLELSQQENGNGARITGDLEVTGNINGNIKDMVLEDVTVDSLTTNGTIGIGIKPPVISDAQLEISRYSSTTHLKLSYNSDDYATFTVADTGDLTIQTVGDGTTDSDLYLIADGDIHLSAAGDNIILKKGIVQIASFEPGIFDLNYNATNYLRTSVNSAGVVTLLTVGGTPTNADFIVDSGGDIVLDSGTGIFRAKNAGTEFSASAYAGMILGYTDIGLNEVRDDLTLTTSYVVPTDEFSVSFTVPPSGNVEIMIQIKFNAGSSGAGDLFAGLSTANATSGYSALQSYHEELLIDQSGRNGTDEQQHYWTLTGLTAGDDLEYWVGFKSSSTSGSPKIEWGGNSSGHNGGFIMKATALPATITT